MTFTHYRGERGEQYWINAGSGKNRRRQRRTRWYPASGSFQRFFDDLLIVASRGLPPKVMRNLEPWPLKDCIPFKPDVLAGFLARTYETSLNDGFLESRRHMNRALEQEVKKRIGGDTQRVHDIDTRYDALTYKHLLMPVWLLGHRYRDKVYQLIVNARTGEVQGERPYSWIKIALAVAAALVIAIPLRLLLANR